MMHDYKDHKLHDYPKIFRNLQKLCETHDITLTNFNFLGVWIPGNYMMEQYGTGYHSNLQEFRDISNK